MRSIYGTVFQDGFGSRSLTIDPETGEQVEVLEFSQALVGVPGFDAAVGERVARLARVRHALYARVRKIDRPAPDALALYSDHVRGWRLADVLAAIDREGLKLDISAVLVLLRQLIPAVALFSRHQRDAVIGTIAPERLILTPQGRLVVAEYVMAPGLEKLGYSRERLWRELRVTLPPAASPTRIPPGADVLGIGVVALSLLLGRLLTRDEYLTSLGELVEGVTETSAGTTRTLSAGFHAWLSRALQFDGQQPLHSTHEAQLAFEEMLAKERAYITTPAQLDLFLQRYQSLLDPKPAPERPAPPAPAAPEIVAADTSAALPAPPAPSAPPAPAAPPTPAAPVSSAPVSPATPVSPASPVAASPSEPLAAAGSGAEGPGAASLAERAPVAVALPSRRMSRLAWAFAALALAEAGVIAWLAVGTGKSEPLADRGELLVHSRPLAARVTIDGEDRGVTPFTGELSAGPHVLEVRVGKSEPRVLPIMIRPGVQSGIYLELQSVATVGGLEVRSAPAKARVTVAGQYRGTTPLTLNDLPPGEVEVLLQAGKRQVKQLVRIEPGITSQLVVPLDR